MEVPARMVWATHATVAVCGKKFNRLVDRDRKLLLCHHRSRFFRSQHFPESFRCATCATTARVQHDGQLVGTVLSDSDDATCENISRTADELVGLVAVRAVSNRSSSLVVRRLDGSSRNPAIR
eukprot:scpid83616/ scgid23277/ 